MYNLNLVKQREANKYFSRNKKKLENNIVDQKIKNLIKDNDIKADSVLEIGCANGNKLNQFAQLLKSKKNFGVDLSKDAIRDGKKRYKNLNLSNISSLEIHKIKINFDFIICGFFLYNLDRELIFRQFDLIHSKLLEGGYLLILDFDPLFKHSNKNIHSKKFTSFKMSYDNFLTESGLFEIIYKIKYKTETNDKKRFKSDTVSLSLFKKINFKKKYPENI